MKGYVVLLVKGTDYAGNETGAWKVYPGSTRQKAAANALADGWRQNGWRVEKVFTMKEWHTASIEQRYFNE